MRNKNAQLPGRPASHSLRTDRPITRACDGIVRRVAIEPLEGRNLFSASYTITDLGTLGGSYSYAQAINEAGQVTGFASTTNDEGSNAFLFTDADSDGQVDPGEMMDLGTLGGWSSEGFTLNEAGQVLGYSDDADGGYHAFTFRDANANGQVDSGEMGNLGAFGGGLSVSYAINEAGQVVGAAFLEDELTQHGFLYTDADGNGRVDPGEVVDLGTFGGMESVANALNESGQVAGYASTAGNAGTRAFIYTDTNGNGQVDPGEMLDLGTLGGTESKANAINEQGQAAGSSSLVGDGVYNSFLYTDANGNGQVDAGEMIDLGNLGGSHSSAFALNDAGQVLGTSTIAGDIATHAYLFTDLNGNGQRDSGEVADLGTLGGLNSLPLALNEAGQVMGQSDALGNEGYHAFLYTDHNGNGLRDAGEMIALHLGGSTSYANAMNSAGQVVGSAVTSDELDMHAFIGSVSGVTDLNHVIPADSGWILQAATAINDRGQIVGYGIVDGEMHAYLLTPATTAPTNTPPVVTGDQVATTQDVPVTVDVLANDTDADGDDLTVASVGSATHGTVVLNADRTITYTPRVGYHGPDQFTYVATDGEHVSEAVTVTVDVVPAAAGSVYLVADDADPSKTALVVNGSTGSELISVLPAANGAGVTVMVGGVAKGTFGPTGRILVYGGTGNDVIHVGASVLNAAWIYGDEGADLLQLGNGGGLALGGEGGDILIGGNGRDVLIGGDGSDLLLGDGGDDVLISSATVYDDRFSVADHRAAWAALYAEWNSSRSFSQRVDNLRDGSGTLARANGTYLLNDATVRNDASADRIDILAGLGGSDWYLYNSGDLAVGLTSAERDEALRNLV